jgi:hypothetical protein
LRSFEIFGSKQPKLADLPATHADDLRQPCDWCGESILHEHPPGDVGLQVGRLVSGDYRRWRICETCVDVLIELIKFRANGSKP